MATTVTLEDRISTVRAEIDDAARSAGRNPGDITLVAVSKTFSREDVEAAYDHGIRHFGENRVQEARSKFAEPLPEGAMLHLIGHLQSNKAKYVPGLFQTVDSVDRQSVVDALDKAAAKTGTALDVLVQVNVAGESQKAGCDPADTSELIESLWRSEWLTPKGLMTIAPIDTKGDALRSVFRSLRELRDDLQNSNPDLPLTELSMGMSNDFAEAIAEGSTQVRVGRALFGER